MLAADARRRRRSFNDCIGVKHISPKTGVFCLSSCFLKPVSGACFLLETRQRLLMLQHITILRFLLIIFLLLQTSYAQSATQSPSLECSLYFNYLYDLSRDQKRNLGEKLQAAQVLQDKGSAAEQLISLYGQKLVGNTTSVEGEQAEFLETVETGGSQNYGMYKNSIRIVKLLQPLPNSGIPMPANRVPFVGSLMGAALGELQEKSQKVVDLMN